MKQERRLQFAFLSAALRHIDRDGAAVTGMPGVIYFLRVTHQQLLAERRYDLCLVVKTLMRQIERDGAVNPIWKQLKSEVSEAKLATVTLTSNTRVTNPEFNQLEAYIEGEVQ
jgi:hypothetical protein